MRFKVLWHLSWGCEFVPLLHSAAIAAECIELPSNVGGHHAHQSLAPSARSTGTMSSAYRPSISCNRVAGRYMPRRSLGGILPATCCRQLAGRIRCAGVAGRGTIDNSHSRHVKGVSR